MTIEKLLKSIGKRTFIKYYYNFKNTSRDHCICSFEENFTDKAKSSKTGHAKSIFKNGLEKEKAEQDAKIKKYRDLMDEQQERAQKSKQRLICVIICCKQ